MTLKEAKSIVEKYGYKVLKEATYSDLIDITDQIDMLWSRDSGNPDLRDLSDKADNLKGKVNDRDLTPTKACKIALGYLKQAKEIA
jgi:hypothetical protein